MATQCKSVTASFGLSFKTVRARIGLATFMRVAALLLLIAQLGLVAHRIEHYIAPEHMECGEDACAAFAPAPASADPVLFLAPLFLIAFFLQFWTVRAFAVRQPIERLGFRAHAPPL